MAKILITGVKGLLGNALAKTLAKQGQQVFGLDLPQDISQRSTIEPLLKSRQTFDWIVHTAAMIDVERCQKEQQLCWQVNTHGTKNILELAEKKSAKLIYISSVAVFDGQKGDYQETDPPCPLNFYSFTKAVAEQIVLTYQKGLVLRINLIGLHPAGSRGINFLEWLVDAIKANKPLKLVSDIRINPLTNWALAELIGQIIQKNISQKIIHLASQDILSKAEIGRLVLKHFPNYKNKITIAKSAEIFKGATRPKESWLNTDLAKKKLKLKMPLIKEELNQAIR